MLSKVAERVYWTARYIERVENTARLIGVYANLLLDLPKDVKLGWYNLVLLNSLEATFDERYKVQDERNVVKFLLGDDTNPSSVISALRMLRENVRTTRDVVPAETWELVNELYIFVSENVQNAVNRGQRHAVLEGIVRGSQQLNGLLYGNMTHDEAWDFLRLGRNLERADMTTRLLDAGVTAAMQTAVEESAVNSRQIIWGNVLRSVGADQAYRRKLRSSVRDYDVVAFLLEDNQFPRTIAHCANAIVDSAAKLPRAKPVVKWLNEFRAAAFEHVPYKDMGEGMRDYLNSLQLELAQVHSRVAETWFNH